MKKLILLILVFLLVYPYAFAQDIVVTPKKKLSEVKEENRIVRKTNDKQQSTQVDFVCSSSGDICKSIDMKKTNPFADLPFPNYQRWARNRYKKYDLSKVSYKKAAKELLPNVKDALNRPCGMYQTRTSSGASLHGDYVLIRHSISIYGEGGGGVAGNTHIAIYNRNGERVFVMKNINEGLSSLVLTEDGRYFAYKYGGFGGPHGDCIVGGSSPYGIKIIDTHTGEVVVDEQPFRDKPHNKSPNWIGIRSGYINIVYKLHDGKGREVVFFDFEKNRRYAKVISPQEQSYLKEFAKEGMIFFDMNSMPDTSKRKVYLFEKDFEQTPIK